MELEKYLLNLEFTMLASSLHQHSLLVEFTIQANASGIGVVPYHASAAYELLHPHKDDVLIGRPSVIASRTSTVFSKEIDSFETLLSQKGLREKRFRAS